MSVIEGFEQEECLLFWSRLKEWAHDNCGEGRLLQNIRQLK